MDNNYEGDFERIKQDVGKLMEATNTFLENVITPVLNDTGNFPAHIELEVNSLIQETKDLAVSFFPLKQRIDEINKRGVDFYSLIEFANTLESNVKEWQSGFTSIKDRYVPIANTLSQTTTVFAEPVDPYELFNSIMDECDKVQRSLEENFLKLFVYKKLEPSVKKISEQVDELKTRLHNLANEWLPQKDKIQELIESLMEQVTRLADTSDFDQTEEESSRLLENQRSLYELFARQQVFKKIEPTLRASLSQLEKLEQSFEEALGQWHPASGEIKTSYESILEKCKQLSPQEEEVSLANAKYEALTSGFSQFEEEWSSAIKDLSTVLNKWVNRT